MSDVTKKNGDMELLRVQGKWFTSFATSTAEHMAFIIKHEEKHLIVFIKEFLINCSVDERKKWCGNIAKWLFTYDLENMQFTKLYDNSDWSKMAKMIATEWFTGIGRWKVHLDDDVKRKHVEAFKLYLSKDFDPDKMEKHIIPAMELITKDAVVMREDMINQLLIIKSELEALIKTIKHDDL